MCQWGTDRTVTIRQTITVDACLADEIVWLNEQGVKTVNSCCGHGKGPGTILIQPSTMDRARELGYTVEFGAVAHLPYIRPRGVAAAPDAGGTPE